MCLPLLIELRRGEACSCFVDFWRRAECFDFVELAIVITFMSPLRGCVLCVVCCVLYVVLMFRCFAAQPVLHRT